jgi:hypothetical protein
MSSISQPPIDQTILSDLVPIFVNTQLSSEVLDQYTRIKNAINSPLRRITHSDHSLSREKFEKKTAVSPFSSFLRENPQEMFYFILKRLDLKAFSHLEMVCADLYGLIKGNLRDLLTQDVFEKIEHYLSKIEDDKDCALRCLVEVYAVSNPTKATELVGLIQSPYPKILALVALAKASASREEDTARDLFQEAIKIAISIKCIGSKQTMLDEIVQATSLTHLDEAIAAVKSFPPFFGRDKEKGLFAIAETCAVSDPLKAQEIADLIEDLPLKVNILLEIAKGKVLINPEQADDIFDVVLEAASQIPDKVSPKSGETQKDSIFCKIAIALAKIDPKRALTLLRGNQISQGDALCEIAQMLIASNPDKAKGLLLDAKKIADNLVQLVDPDYAVQIHLLCKIAKVMALINMKAAKDLIPQLLTIIPTRVRIVRKLDLWTDRKEVMDHWIPEIVQTIAEIDNDHKKDLENELFVLLKETIDLIQNPLIKVRSLCDIIPIYALRNPHKANDLLQCAFNVTHTQDFSPRKLFHEIVNAIAQTNLDNANDLLQQAAHAVNLLRENPNDHPWTIKDKIKILCEIAKAQAIKDIEKADAFIHQALWIANNASDIESEDQCILFCKIAQALEEIKRLPREVF